MRILLFLLILLFFSNRGNSENISYILISFSNCTFCNNSLRLVQDKNQLIASSVLLGSADDASLNQLKSLANENFNIKFKGYKIDTKLFDKISEGILYKMPCYAIVNSQNQVVFKTTVDSVSFYQAIIRQHLSPKLKISKSKPLANKRLSNIGGYSSIQKFKNRVGISYFNKSDRIYFLDTKTNLLDSLYFSNDAVLLGKLFKLAGVNDCDPESSITFYKENQLPYDLHHFGSLTLNGDVLTTTDHLLYINPKDTMEYISPNWKQFVLSISLQKKNVGFYYIDQWHDSMNKPSQFVDYDFNDQFYYKESDSTWLISGKKLNPPNPTDLNLFMIRFKSYPGNTLVPISIDSFPKIAFNDFNGKSLNKPSFIIPFEYSKELLYFNESPFFLVNNTWVDIQKSIRNINWIYDIDIDSTGQLLTLVIRESNNNKSVIYYDYRSKSVISSVKLPKFDPKSNVILQNNELIFLDSEGRLCCYTIGQ